MLRTNIVLITIVIVATVLTFAAYVVAGRFAGLSITALCGASTGIFLDAADFLHSCLPIARYRRACPLRFCWIGPRKVSVKKRGALVQGHTICDFGARKRVVTDLSLAIADLISSDLGVPFGAVDFDVASEGLALPCTPDETRLILSDVLTAALQTPGVQRVSFYGGQGPNIRRLIIVAHYVWPRPQFKVITVGRRDEDCEPVHFPGWPFHSCASWFDNGYDRIYQISVEVHR